MIRTNKSATSSSSNNRRRPEGRSACVVHVETHTILIVCFLINIFWFYYLASSSQLSTTSSSTASFGLESVVASSLTSVFHHQDDSSPARREHEKAQEEQMFAFTMRDARRLVPVDPPLGIHIYDYVDIYNADQTVGKAQLYLDGQYVDQAPCKRYLKKYSLECYKDKILQVFSHAMNTAAPQQQYFFYMESDNTLCLPLDQIQALAVRHNRYFIATGVGASGWIMRRDFMVDFLDKYDQLGNRINLRNPSDESFRMPDLVAAWLLMEKNQWSVSNRYLVAHTILNGIGDNALTQAKPGNHKHLPRCLEPHRGKWVKDKDTQKVLGDEDAFGWDYFDYTKCPHAEVYPCHEDDEASRTRSPHRAKVPIRVVEMGKDGKKVTRFTFDDASASETNGTVTTGTAAKSYGVSLQINNQNAA